ncbi:hypothetical protein LJB95_03070 [Paludibacteraceae bacterium OttesenSCG-928-F17]|nr:hypothetical protein [Paludibacteraceae bacterium OttesenSCG-928-F17]
MELNNIEFTEKQRFTQWYVWIILLFVNSLMTYYLVKAIQLNENTAIWIVSIITAIIFIYTVFILSAKLKTTINKEGILLQYPVLKDKFFSWDDISYVHFRKTSGITEFGGYGIWFGNKKSIIYLIKGNTGLQIELKNKNKILIGTTKQKEMAEVLKELGKIN